MKKVEILERGLEWYYDIVLNASNETISKEVGDETMDILEMFRQLDSFVEQLNPEERDRLNLNKLKFDGFDSNNDEHYTFMKFIVEKDARYQERKDMYMNSHTAFSIQKYRSMLPIYRQLKTQNNGNLRLADLLQIQSSF
jgi:uncharacterized protein YfbU (UPF0304 family)